MLKIKITLVFCVIFLVQVNDSFCAPSRDTFSPNSGKVWAGIHCRRERGSVWFSSRKNRLLTGFESFNLKISNLQFSEGGKLQVQGIAAGLNCELFSPSPVEYIVSTDSLSGVNGPTLSLRTDQSSIWAEHFKRVELPLRDGISFNSEIPLESILNDHQLRALQAGGPLKLLFYLDFTFPTTKGREMHNWFELSLSVKRNTEGKTITELKQLAGPFGNRTDY